MFNSFNFATGFQSRNVPTKFVTALVTAAIAFVALAPPKATAQSERYSVKIENRSSYAIYGLFISRTTLDVWGPDRLGDQVLRPGYSATLPPLREGEYDLKLVDEDDDTCVVSDVSVDGNTSWVITDSWLLRCEFHNRR